MTRSLADRFLHVCYNCAITDLDDTVAFFTTELELSLVMRSPVTSSDGALLGFASPIESAAVFLYDARGPRSSPAVEVQGWKTPTVVGEVASDSGDIGIHALGFMVDDVDASADRLVRAGCTRGASGGANSADEFGGRGVRLRDPRGVGIDLVARDAVSQDDGIRLSHVRIACRDLATSVTWYQQFGFERVETPELWGTTDAVVRLRLECNDVDILLTEAISQGERRPARTAANTRGLFRCATRVESVAAAVTELASRGIPVVAGPSSVAIAGTALPDLVIAMVCDPDGIVYELVQRPADLFR